MKKNTILTLFWKHCSLTVKKLLFLGPSEAKHGLAKAITEHEPRQLIVVGVKSADQMTQHQMVAWVRTFFDRPAPRRLPV